MWWKKLFGWLFLAFLIWFIAFRPGPAADVFESLGGTIGEMATGFGTFFTRLVT
jgi:hypothetical protein